ncbi:MAG TPA: AAA family ATPase, partial [Candidatus Limnocylindrales bacterium]|nr:AAA family ATPase [Candidatus Limnocylindrales bacterium]
MGRGIASEGFVGRERPFVRLAEALDAAAAGRPRLVLVAAEAGLGATRLLTELERRVARLAEPVTVLRGDALADEPYGGLLAPLRPLLLAADDATLADVAGSSGEEIARLVPELGPRLRSLGLMPDRPRIVDPERRQPRVLEAIHALLVRLGERRPVLLLLENLHRADAGTRRLVAFLGRISRPGRFCVVGTYQPDQMTAGHPLAATLAELAEPPRPPEVLRLEPLTRDELAALIEGIEGDRPSASVLLLVAERSRGVPLVAEELLAARRELSSAPLTGSFGELVIARLGIRSPECRRVLRLLALAERPLSIAELAAASAAFEAGATRRPPRSVTPPRRGPSRLDPDLAAGLGEAVEHGFLVHGAVPGAGPGEWVAFRHESISRAVAADLLPALRVRHHAA